MGRSHIGDGNRLWNWVRGQFRQLALPPIQSLDIPDAYEFMDEELIAAIKSGAEHYIDWIVRKQ